MRIGQQAYMGAGATAARLRSTAVQSSASSRQKTASLSTDSKNKIQDLKAGFGKDTLSIGNIALRTLGTNLKSARRVVPSVEELIDEAQMRNAEQKTASEEAVEKLKEDSQEEVSFRPAPTTEARRFEEPYSAPASTAPQEDTPESPDSPPRSLDVLI